MSKRPDPLATYRAIPLFRQCSDDELALVDAVADEVHVTAGRTLIRQGELGREFVVIIEGTASVERNGDEVATLGPGQHFGELALLVDHPRNATVVATSDLTAQVIERRGFEQLLETSPHLTKNLLLSLAARLAEVDDGH
jgi:CRP/FNR family transcriptional regulator, cyclic AMP receptor protein